MADLSAYINFACVLNKGTQQISIVDNSAYPAGIAPTVTGILSIKQPDGITVSGNFASPDIYWSGSSLHIALKPLRLSTTNTFQNGSYSITYTVRSAGYTDTVLTKTFNLYYTAPTLVMTANMDVFTPDLSVQDSTTYGMSGFNYLSTGYAWAATIDSVLGTPQNIIGNTQNFEMSYGGSFYDSKYSVMLTSTPSWTLAAVNPFVTIVDQLAVSGVYYAQIPPSLSTLLTQLSVLKTQVDASACDCNTYSVLRDQYLLAESIYTHMRDRGSIGDLAGLSLYVFQLEKLFNNGVTPSYVNTYTVIPPYDWGSSGGGSSWASITGKPSSAIVEWIVGQGGFPGNGVSVLTDARFAGYKVRVFRAGLRQNGSNPGDGSSYYTKNLADNFVTFIPALSTGEILAVESLPL